MGSSKIFFLLIAMIFPFAIFANENEDVLQRARELVNNFLNSTANGLAPGMVIGVSVKGEQKWLEGFGLANIENNVTMTGDAVMQIGSIGKSFTFALAAQLIYQEKLNLDAPISDYVSCDEFPDRTWNGSAVNITMRQLFQMTSGMPEGPLEEDVGFCLRCENYSDRLKFLQGKDLVFEPDTNFTYSNFGTEVAGAIIEKLLENETFSVAYMDMVKNILKLNNTALINTSLITPNLASFYYSDMGNVFNSGMWGDLFLNEFPAAGAIISTMSDVLAYGQAWLDAYFGRSEHFVKQSTVREAWIPTDVSKAIVPYGLAWLISNVTGNRPSGNYVVYHSGGTLGCRSMLAIYPETEIIIAASANLAESPVPAFILEGTIADLFANITKEQ